MRAIIKKILYLSIEQTVHILNKMFVLFSLGHTKICCLNFTELGECFIPDPFCVFKEIQIQQVNQVKWKAINQIVTNQKARVVDTTFIQEEKQAKKKKEKKTVIQISNLTLFSELVQHFPKCSPQDTTSLSTNT